MKNYNLLSKDEIKNLSLEELKEAKEFFIKEKELNQQIIDDKTVKSESKTELYTDNNDINDRLNIINEKIDENQTLK